MAQAGKIKKMILKEWAGMWYHFKTESVKFVLPSCKTIWTVWALTLDLNLGFCIDTTDLKFERKQDY